MADKPVGGKTVIGKFGDRGAFSEGGIKRGRRGD